MDEKQARATESSTCSPKNAPSAVKAQIPDGDPRANGHRRAQGLKNRTELRKGSALVGSLGAVLCQRFSPMPFLLERSRGCLGADILALPGDSVLQNPRHE